MIVAGLLAGVLPVLAETIAPDDTLEIRVMEWDAIEGEMVAWSGWTSIYTVDADGAIVVPFLGTLKAAETRPADLGGSIANRLLDRLGLMDEPAVTVTITERPPVFVSGLVRDGGPMEYRDGMTARKALARAGGIPLTGIESTDPLRARLEAENRLEDLRRREDELATRAARLGAEVDRLDAIDFPPLLDPAANGVLRERERRLFEMNREETERRLSLIEGSLRLLENEIETLREKLVLINDQLATAREQLEATRGLSERGLANNARLLSSQQQVTSLQSQDFDAGSAILQAQQDIARAEAERLEIVQGRTARRLSELQTTTSQLEDTRSERELQRRIAAMLTAVEDPEEALQVTIRRGREDMLQGLDTILVPGDIVEIRLKPVEISG
ncbi:polysaccharide biosynthesis/export family protein [Palleronia abyssalis]|uniref:Chromosome partition protein Smc n=1 Tax=Palleronia abyssalis TaxID=1501240 RepID=A0A2R8BZD6_9RHOB|nr:polysaccharide biosynthesis/export family protein [Palleronia abyssalis]SPJ25541.1 hypothetical protein PAA8504_03392 [Palleronia abyssalis]